MKLIPLTKGKFAMVDDEDFERVNQYKWSYDGRGYAVRGAGGRKNHKMILMHRFILGAKRGEIIDHIDLVGFNNQKTNLRFCTHSQNLWNSKRAKNNTTGVKGVTFNKRTKKFVAQLVANGKHYFLGYFKTLKQAGDAYRRAAITHHGIFARW